MKKIFGYCGITLHADGYVLTRPSRMKSSEKRIVITR